MKSIIAIVLSALLAQPALAAAADQSRTVQETVVEIPQGSIVEVRLNRKERLRGRLDEISLDGLAMTLAKGNQKQTRQVSFADVKPMKQFDQHKPNPIGNAHVLPPFTA